MGEVVEDFVNSWITSLPAQRRFQGAEVKKWKQISYGDFDDWGSGVAGLYAALVYKNNKPFAIITYEVKLDDRWQGGDDDEPEQQPYSSFEEAATIKQKKIKLIKSIPAIFKRQ